MNLSQREIKKFITTDFSPTKKDIIVAGINIGRYEETVIVAVKISKNLPNKVIAINYISGKTYIEHARKIINFIKCYNISSVLIDSFPMDVFESLLIGEIYDRKILCRVNNFVCNKKSKTELIQNAIYKLDTGLLQIHNYAPTTISYLLEDLYLYNCTMPDKVGRTMFTVALAQRQAEETRRLECIVADSPKKSLWARIISWIKNYLGVRR